MLDISSRDQILRVIGGAAEHIATDNNLTVRVGRYARTGDRAATVIWLLASLRQLKTLAALFGWPLGRRRS